MSFQKFFAVPVATVFLLSVLLITSGAAGSCGKTSTGTPETPEQTKARLLSYARDVVTSFQAITPIVTHDHPELAAQLARGLSNALQLITAISNSDQTQATALLADIFPTFSTIADTYTNNGTVLALLAIGDIALHFFADHFVAPVSKAARANPVTAAILDFKARPQFGCQYAPEKCAAGANP